MLFHDNVKFKVKNTKSILIILRHVLYLMVTQGICYKHNLINKYKLMFSEYYLTHSKNTMCY